MGNKNSHIIRKNQIRLYDLALLEENSIKPDTSHIVIDMNSKKIYCKTCKKQKDLNILDCSISLEVKEEIDKFKIEHKNCKIKKL